MNNQSWNQNSQQYQQMPGQYQQMPVQRPTYPMNPNGNTPKNNKGLIIGLIITSVFLVVAIALIIILVLSKDKDKKDDKTTVVTTETTITDTEERTTDTEEQTTEPTTEEPIVKAVDYSIYYSVLREMRYCIDTYDWQYGFSYSDGDVIPKQRPIAITDITGDGVDELIFLHAIDKIKATLDIYTIGDDGSVVKLFSEDWDIQVAGGTKYYLFKTDDSDSLFAYTSISDEWTNGTIYEFVQSSASEITTKELATSSKGPNEDYSDTIGYFTIAGKDCTEEEFDSYFNSLKSHANEVVIYNRNHGEDYTGVSELLGHAEDIAISFGQAASLLLIVEPEEGYLPLSMMIPMSFTSGAGAWSTDILLYPDGTFTGSYHDSNMGESGAGYDSTVYHCSFEGSFKNIQKLDDKTYTMELDTLTVVDPKEDERIEDGVCYRKGEPYGIQGGTFYELYLPGIEVSKVPQGFIQWAWDVENQETMDMVGLYNVDTEEGFLFY